MLQFGVETAVSVIVKSKLTFWPTFFKLSVRPVVLITLV